MKHGKKYIESAALVDRLKQYDPMEGMELVKTIVAKGKLVNLVLKPQSK